MVERAVASVGTACYSPAHERWFYWLQNSTDFYLHCLSFMLAVIEVGIRACFTQNAGISCCQVVTAEPLSLSHVPAEPKPTKSLED